MHVEHLAARVEDGLRRHPRHLRRLSVRFERSVRLVARKTQDRLLGVARRIVDPHVEQEPVELRFGKGIGAFLLDRILGRHDQEQGR